MSLDLFLRLIIVVVIIIIIIIIIITASLLFLFHFKEAVENSSQRWDVDFVRGLQVLLDLCYYPTNQEASQSPRQRNKYVCVHNHTHAQMVLRVLTNTACTRENGRK